MADFDINAHLQQMGFGRGGKAESKDPTNEETIIDPVLKEAAKNAAGVTHLLGIDLQSLGEAGIQQGLETEGLAGKTIMPSAIPDAPGGVIARILHSVFIKNKEITNNAHDLAGGAPIEGQFSGDGFQGGDFSAMIGGGQGSMGDFAFMDYGTGNFSMLNNLPSPLPMDAPIMTGRGGMDLA